MKIYLASDHAGFEMKEAVAQMLIEKKFDVVDKRAYEENSKDDYPELIRAAAEPLTKEKDSLAIVFGGSGQGEAMVANRFDGVRATVYYGGDKEILKLSKEHNNANVLSIGARFVSLGDAKEAVSIWLDAKFGGEPRHKRRLKQMDEYDD